MNLVTPNGLIFQELEIILVIIGAEDNGVLSLTMILDTASLENMMKL
jgi:hypothetical protein